MANNVWVIGDTIIDVNTYGEPIGLSAETPTVCMRWVRETTTLGGAAFVARNLDALGQAYTLVSNDSVGLPTTTKHRFWCGGYKLLQVNRVESILNNAASEDAVLDSLLSLHISAGDIVVFADYRNGLLTEYIVAAVIRRCEEVGAITFADSQVSKRPSNHEWYEYVDIMFVNEHEERYVPGSFCGRLVVKHGANGASEHYDDQEIHVPGHSINVVDTCGAGDAFLAAYVYQYLRNPRTALEFANRWAALKCTKSGMETPSLEDLEHV